MLSDGYRFYPNREVIAQRMGSELILLHLGSQKFYELNATAARLWELLEDGAAVDAAVIQLTKEYAVSEDRVAEEARGVLTELVKHDLLVADCKAESPASEGSPGS